MIFFFFFFFLVTNLHKCTPLSLLYVAHAETQSAKIYCLCFFTRPDLLILHTRGHLQSYYNYETEHYIYDIDLSVSNEFDVDSVLTCSANSCTRAWKAQMQYVW